MADDPRHPGGAADSRHATLQQMVPPVGGAAAPTSTWRLVRGTSNSRSLVRRGCAGTITSSRHRGAVTDYRPGRRCARARVAVRAGAGTNPGGNDDAGAGGRSNAERLQSAVGGVIVSAAAASLLMLGGPSCSGDATTGAASRLLTASGLGVPEAYADDGMEADADAETSTAASSETLAAPSTPSPLSSDVQIVDEVWKVVDENFLPARADDGFDRAAWAKLRDEYLAAPPSSRAEAYGVVRDILRTLDDPFSRFVEPADFAPLLKYDISGVGLNIAEDPEDPSRLKVLGLVLDSSAARAGVKQGDELVAVDGVSVRDRSAFQAVSLIQAAPAPDVKVTVRAGADDETREVTLRRSSSASNPVSARMESGNVGYIRLREFNSLAEPGVARAVESLRADGARSFVLDLRDNPGGLVQAGVEIARLFLPADTNVAYTEGRVVAGGVKGDTEFNATVANGSGGGGKGGGLKGGILGGGKSERNSQLSRGGGSGGAGTRLKSIPSASKPSVTEPLVVLVNGRSASASEILTGALKDNCRATVAGSRTYGKGLIQSVYELSDGSGLVLTVGKYVTPGLNDIDRQGIQPNFAMFPGFEKAQEELRSCKLPVLAGK